MLWLNHTLRWVDLRQRIVQFKQGNQPIAMYYSSLRKMWDELEHYTTYCLACVKDTTKYKKHVENIHIFEFLAGLNSKCEQLRALILGNDPLLSLNEVYAHIHRDDRRRGVMNLSLTEKSTPMPTSIRGGRGGNFGRSHGGRQNFTSNDRDRLNCEHCGLSRHTKEQCCDLHRRPLDLPPRLSQLGGSGNGRGSGRFDTRRLHAQSATSTPTEMIFTTLVTLQFRFSDEGLSKDEIAAFKHFVSQLEHPSDALTSSFAYLGTSASALSACV